MQTFKKRHGVTVNLYLDGSGYDSCLDLTCENSGTANKCKYALGEISPMPEGMPCCFREDGRCRLLVAQLDALKKAKSAIIAEIKEIESQIEE